MEPMNTNTWGTVRYSARDIAEGLQSHLPEAQRLYPTEEQTRIIEAGPAPMLVVAGAGSGKTHTMTDRVVWLVANGLVRPEEILGVTFTRKAAGELSERINAAIEQLAAHDGLEVDLDPESVGRAAVSTYHSYANALVADHGLRIGVEPDAQLVGEAQSYQLAAQVVRAYDGDLSFTDALTFSTLVGNVRQLSSDCAEHLVEPDQVRGFLADVLAEGHALPLKGRSNQRIQGTFEMLQLRSAMAEMVVRYQQAKQEASVMDYGDLVAYAARIAREIPEVGDAERSRYRVVLLDEFQDTSHAQMTLFAYLYGRHSGAGIGHPVTAVGDPNQSIYGFRGASAGQLFSFPHQFPQVTGDDWGADLSPAEKLQLTTAWRNAEQILDGANAVADRLRTALSAPGSSTEMIPQLQPRPGAPLGETRANWFADSATEAENIAELLGDLLTGQTDDASRTAAVLCRRRAQFGPLAEALDAAGVPYEIVGLSGLLSTPEVIEVVAILQVLADPARSDALMRVMTNPRWRIGPADLWVLHEHAVQLTAGNHTDTVDEDVDESSVIEALMSLPTADFTSRTGRQFSVEGHRRLNQLAQELQRLTTHLHLELPDLIRHIEHSTGLNLEVLSHPGASLATARRHLDRFLEAAEEFAASLDPTVGEDLPAFLAWLEVAEEAERGLSMEAADPRPDAVQLLTAHSSKGLEWDVVVVPGLVDGDFPSNRADVWTGLKKGALPWDLRGDADGLPQWDRAGWDSVNDWADAAEGRTEKKAEELGPDLKTKVKEHSLLEERRLAYVAYTRARDLLWLSGSAWVGTRKTMSTPSEFLSEMEQHPSVTIGTWEELPEEAENPQAGRTQAASWPFDPLDGPTISYVENPENLRTSATEAIPPRSRPRRQALETVAEWIRHADQSQPIDDADLAERIRWVLDRRILHHDRQPDQAVQLPNHISASTFVELADDPTTVARQLRRPMPRQPKPAARAGTVFHTWIEEHFGRMQPGATGMLDIEDPHLAVDDDVDAALGVTDMREKFLATEWAQTPPAYIEAAVETTVGGVTLRGRIDAVFRSGGDPNIDYDPQAQWELVDWKTGQVPRTQAELDNKGLQLAVYRLAWSRLHSIPLENITGRFVYIAHGDERTPHHLADEAELERILAAATG